MLRMRWAIWLLLSLALSSCLSNTVRYEIPPSPHALTGISYLYVDEVRGQGNWLLKEILIQEINRVPNFEPLFQFPAKRLRESAVISAEVLVYSVRDENDSKPDVKIKLVQREVIERPQHTNARVRTQVTEFVEIPFQQATIHRTIDLQVRFTVIFPPNNEVLYKNIEKISFQQSYVGEESIQLMPRAEHEIERLGRLLVTRFVERLNPSKSQKRLELEKGSAPVPMTLQSLDVGHPRILSGNRYATAQRYDQAIRTWSYVVFSPQAYPKYEKFRFNDTVFTRLKAAKLPEELIRKLFELKGQEFNEDNLERILVKMLSPEHYRYYSRMIKMHARTTRENDRVNVAAAHYNLGAIYHIQNNLLLAAFHFAQANAFNPRLKYAQAWTDVQLELGDFNPLDTLMERTIQAASKQEPPSEARVRPSETPFEIPEQSQEQKPDSEFELKPVELPLLQEDIGPMPSSTQPVETQTLDLN